MADVALVLSIAFFSSIMVTPIRKDVIIARVAAGMVVALVEWLIS